MNDPNHCVTEGCGCALGPDSLEILHKGEVIGILCENCIRATNGLKIILKKNDKGMLELEHVDFVERPL